MSSQQHRDTSACQPCSLLIFTSAEAMITPSSTSSPARRTLALAILACAAGLSSVQASQYDPHPPEDGVPSWFEGKQPVRRHTPLPHPTANALHPLVAGFSVA